MANPKKRSFDPYKKVKQIATVIGAVLVYRAFEWWSSPQKAAEQLATEIAGIAMRGGLIVGASTGIIYGMERLAGYLDKIEQKNDAFDDKFDQNKLDFIIHHASRKPIAKAEPANANRDDLRRRVLANK